MKITATTDMPLDRWTSEYWEWRETWDQKDNAIALMLDENDLCKFEERLFRIDSGLDLQADEEPIHVATKKDDDELRTDAIRLSDLPAVGSRVRYKGRLYVPNRPYKSGSKFVVLAVKAGYARLVAFSPDDVDVTQDWGEFTPQRWANLYHSFGSPMVEELPEEESKADADGDRILDDAEFDAEGAINLLQVLEDAVGNRDANN